MLTIGEIRQRLATLRAKMHSCNRNPVPGRARIEWRGELDAIIAEIDVCEPSATAETVEVVA